MREELKKYFIKDIELNSVDEDMLSSKDVAENINLIIDNTKPSYAIAVTGKTGLGKSSIINLVTEKYEDDKDNYNVRKINVWKDDVSLKDLLQTKYITSVDKNTAYNNMNSSSNAVNMSAEQRQEILDSIYNQSQSQNESELKESNQDDSIDYNEISNNTKKSTLKTLKGIGIAVLTFLVCFLITSIIFVLMEYLTSANIYNKNDIFFVENTYLSYKENFGFIMVFAIGLTLITYILRTLIATNRKKAKSIKSEKESEIGNQVNSEYLNSNINYNANSANNLNENVSMVQVPAHAVESFIAVNSIIEPNKTNIIVIEDVDKLPLFKMLKSLEDIKYCSNYENTIFIVPFDEDVLRKAIEARNASKTSATYKPLKFEKVLDKIFQFKVYVPRISNGNIKDYALDLANDSIPDFIEDYSNKDMLKRVIKNVLIYKNVTTPRHVKKLINQFVNNKLLITARVKNEKVNEDIIKANNFDLQLAKLTVLQSDFDEFYDLLFANTEYLEILTKLCCLEPAELVDVYEGIDDELKPFFTVKYRPLRNFLKQTRNYEIENIATLMYLTKIKAEMMFKDKSIYSYVSGEEDVAELRIQDVLELVKSLEDKEDLSEFASNNYEKLLEKYEEKASNKIFYTNMNEITDVLYDYIDEPHYTRYLEIVANNYNYYPEEAFEMFKNTENEIPVSVMNVLFEKMNEGLSKDNFDETFDFLRDNCDAFFEEGGNVSGYVQFLVDNIALSSNPTEVINELDDNFTRIGKVYDLYENIQGLENLDYDVAYKFISKCLDNSDLDKMVNVMNSILSNENSVENCISIEKNMNNYNLVDVIECNVDDIIDYDYMNKKKNAKQEDSESEDEEDVDDNKDSEENVENEAAYENAKFIEGNYTLLKNLLEVCSVKQQYLAPEDVMKITEKALLNNSSEYLLEVYAMLNKFDRMYFYEIRRDFNDVIYTNFHNTQNEDVKNTAVECTKYFKNTRLFKMKLTEDEVKYYSEN
ncbi:MAG: hypothetical protein IJ690_04685 [Clostridia bacterium]|nr:hypothetical protein [Clostridia bacterium]